MARLAEAEAELEAIAGLRGGRLRMAAFESAGATLMPPAIAAFREQHPAVELSMSMSEPEDCVPLLRSGELDLAIVFESAVQRADDGIERVHLIEDPMFLVLPRDHPLAEPPPRPPRRPGGRGVDRRQAGLRVQPAHAARVRDRRLPAADRLRDRRLHGDAGLRGRRRRRLADRRARPHDRARRHRGARPRARHPGAPDLRRHARRRLPLACHPGDAGDPARRRRALRVAPLAARARRLSGKRMLHGDAQRSSSPPPAARRRSSHESPVPGARPRRRGPLGLRRRGRQPRRRRADRHARGAGRGQAGREADDAVDRRRRQRRSRHHLLLDGLHGVVRDPAAAVLVEARRRPDAGAQTSPRRRRRSRATAGRSRSGSATACASRGR